MVEYEAVHVGHLPRYKIKTYRRKKRGKGKKIKLVKINYKPRTVPVDEFGVYRKKPVKKR